MRKENSTPAVRSLRFNRALLPPPSAFYKQELGQLGRADTRGWLRCKQKCFRCGHGGFGVNLRSGGFYCLACGVKGGDVLAFYMLRYRVDFVTAFRRLGACEDDPNPAESGRQREQEARHRELREIRELAEKLRANAEIIYTARWLNTLWELYRWASEEIDLQNNFDADLEPLWELMAALLPKLREADAEYCRRAGLPCDDHTFDTGQASGVRLYFPLRRVDNVDFSGEVTVP